MDHDEREVENQKLKQIASQTGEPFIPVRTLEDVLQTEYFSKKINGHNIGIKILFGLIDSGGHRTNEVYRFVAKHKNLWNFKGNGRLSTGDRYKISKERPKLLLAKSKEFQSDLIYYLYSQRDHRTKYLTLPHETELSDQFIDQIVCVKPDPTIKFGHLPVNWSPQNQQHDFFDVLKYFFVVLEFCVDKLPKDKWRYGKAEMIVKRWKDVKPKKRIDDSNNSKSTASWI
nr:MAG TPA: terminase large subunit [Bacteriophage sp.]